jgi:malonate transporter
MSVFLLILPDFLLIALGWVLFHKLNFSRDFFKGAEQLVYFVLFPALLFHSLVRTPLSLSTMYMVILATVLITAAGIFLAWLAKPVLKPDPVAHASVAQCGYRFNTYIGLSLAGSLAGSEGQTIAAIMVGVAVPLVNMAAVHSLARQSGGSILGEILRNPLIVAALCGVIWNLSGLGLPDAVSVTLSRLGACALAIGLLCVGASLSLGGMRGASSLMGWMIGVRLMAMPVVALFIGWALDLSVLERQILLLFSSLPTAPSTYVLAVRMGGDGRLVAVTMSAGTLLAAASIPFWLTVSPY